MLNIPPNTTIYWHTEPTDMRKGIDGLSGIVRGEFDDDFNGHPLDGSLYLFIWSKRKRTRSATCMAKSKHSSSSKKSSSC